MPTGCNKRYRDSLRAARDITKAVGHFKRKGRRAVKRARASCKRLHGVVVHHSASQEAPDLRERKASLRATMKALRKYDAERAEWEEQTEAALASVTAEMRKAKKLYTSETVSSKNVKRLGADPRKPRPTPEVPALPLALPLLCSPFHVTEKKIKTNRV